MNYSNELSREIILDHVQNPKNIKDINKNIYLEAYLKNPSCGDEVTIYLLKDEKKIIDITYDVHGCSICKSSTSIMSDLLINKTIAEANVIISNINNMLLGESYDKTILGEAIAFEGVKNLPPRIKCTLLPYKAYKKAIGDEHGL